MITAIIQARLSSTRFPKKIFSDLCGKPLIWHIVDRLRWSKRIENILLATTTNKLDDALYEWALKNNVNVFRGNENDVLDRYYNAAVFSKAATIVRITADDPFKDPRVTDNVIDVFLKGKYDFAYNNHPPSFPEGLDAEIFSFDALKKAAGNSKDPFEREHVTQYFYKNPSIFKHTNVAYKTDISYLRWTMDTEKDYKMISLVYKNLYKEGCIFLMDDILEFLKKNPEIEKINMGVKRSTMYSKKIKTV
jgi:spore coat polysaccharide biosynthesis protein SpsF